MSTMLSACCSTLSAAGKRKYFLLVMRVRMDRQARLMDRGGDLYLLPGNLTQWLGCSVLYVTKRRTEWWRNPTKRALINDVRFGYITQDDE